MKKPSALVLIPSGVLLAILSGHLGAVPGRAARAVQAHPKTTLASSPASNTQPASPRNGGDRQSLATVSSVSIQSGGAGKTWVDIATTVPTAYHVEHMDHPWRVVVDVKDSRDRTPRHVYSVESSVLKQVKVQQYRAEPGSHIVRVVAVLVGDTAFDVQQRPSGVRIQLEARTRASDVAPHQTAGGGPSASSLAAGTKAKPPLVAKAAPPSTPVSRASPSVSRSNALAGLPFQPAPAPVPAKSGPTAPAKVERVDISRAGAEANRSQTAGPGLPPSPMVQVATSSGRESRVASHASPAPKPPKDATTSPEPASQVAPAHTGRGAPSESELPTDSGAAAASPGQTFGPQPIAQVVALAPAREAATANPGRVTPTDNGAPQRPSSAGGGIPTQQNPPASAQTPAPSTGSQAITLVPEASVPTAAPPKYSGDLVSMNLKDVDLKDFFRMIHEVSGLNIVVDSGVNGGVTMVLDRVPWDQALDLVLRDNALGKVLEGNILRISRLETLEKEQEDNAKLADAREDAEPLVTIIIPLKYASAVDRTPTQATISGGGAGGGGGSSQQQNIIIPGVVSILTGHVSAGGSSGGGGGASQGRSVLSKRGSAIPDTRNNSIILTDVPSRIALVESVIAKLDTPAKQVSIEARIVVANSDFVRSIQSALNFGSVNPSGSTVTGGATGTGASAQGNIPTPTSSGGATPPRVTIGQTAASGFGAFAISNQSMRYFINAAISAAETHDRAKVISAPTVVTQNNWPAVVLQGVQIPIQTTINNTISTQFVNAALMLQVTPTVTEGGHLFLQLSVANNSVGAVLTGAAGPSINTQAATTQVMVPDGGTVVFGGVKVTSRTRSVTQVPVLGDVPLLGNLFRSSNLEDSDQELLFFVSPKILPE